MLDIDHFPSKVIHEPKSGRPSVPRPFDGDAF
jgi:hypothetical protein